MRLYQEFLIGQTDNVTKEVNVSGAVITKTNDEGGKSILLIRRSPEDHWPNVWEFPRGKCDKGDKNQIEKCLKREVKEETGLDVEIEKFIDKYEYIADKGTRRSTQFNFLCHLKNPNQEIKLSFEHSEFKWISSVGEVELLIPAEMKKTISKVLDNSLVNYQNTETVIKETQRKWKMK